MFAVAERAGPEQQAPLPPPPPPEDGFTEEMLDWLRDGMGSAEAGQAADPCAPLSGASEYAGPSAAANLGAQPSSSAFALDAALLPHDSSFGGQQGR